MEMNGRSDTRDKLLDDLRLVIRDAEDLLRSTGKQVDEGYQIARAKFESTLSSAKSGLTTLEERVADSTRDAINTADQYVQAHPWQAVGLGALTGLAIGLLVSRR
jgi:ElaB/YqjD/DUF883 family membrane-anchored ribosome-binding protein